MIPLKVFKMRLLGRGFHTQCFVLCPNRCEIAQSTPLRGSTSSLALIPFSNRYGTPQSTLFGASVLVSTLPRVHPLQGSTSSLIHRPVSGSDIIYNSPGPPLADISLFGLFLSDLRLLGRGLHTLIKNISFSSPTDVRSHNFLP